MYKILIVEDDSVIARSIQKQLSAWGLEVECVDDFRQVMTCFARFQPHLVLLDLSLPFYNGFHWCEEIRKISQIPVIFISSASDQMNMVMAMTRGADDFVAKPFDMQVLVAKVQAMLRRAYSFGNPASLVEHKGAILNLSYGSLFYQGENLELTKNEFRILKLLMENHGNVVSRETIMEKLWESDSFIDDNTLTVNVTRLRRKLETIGMKEFIQTKKGVGYLV